MYNDMDIFSSPSMGAEGDVYDSLLEMAGVSVIYLNFGLPFSDRLCRIVFYSHEGEIENGSDNDEFLRNDGGNGRG